MPYPHEHACRLRDPSEFAPRTFRSMHRKHGSKVYRVIIGKLRWRSAAADSMVEQAYRYPTAEWSEEEARAHCDAHGGRVFEPAATSDVAAR